jgi:hypothetical protein
MGLTQKLGTIPLAVFTDSSNNVGIGASANASFKLQVTGATNLTGALSGTSAAFSSSVTATGVSYISGNSNTGPIPYLQFTDNYGSAGRNWALINGYDNYGTLSFKVGTSIGGNPYTGTSVLSMTQSSNVGIGTSSPQSIVHASKSNSTAPTSGTTPSGYALSYGAGDGNNGGLWFSTDFGGDQGIAGIAGTRVSGYETDLRFYTNNTNSARAFTERMRIRNDGIVMIGTTTYNSALKGVLLNPDGYAFYTANGANVMYLNRLTSDGNILQFQKDTSVVGSISTNTYSLPSDLNFKKNISNLELGLNLITKLRAVSYNHKIDDADAALSTGFIAQELEQSLIELGVKENEYYILQHKPNEDKKQSQYWLDYTKMIPILVKAIQELTQKVNALENR